MSPITDEWIPVDYLANPHNQVRAAMLTVREGSGAGMESEGGPVFAE
ncbi:MAG: hypothetical protein OES18_20215 [Deltaproteobacteria bacterium]|nr:hypothetical protein [Deltaproteobacteria bacterium]